MARKPFGPRPERAERFLWQPGDLKRVGDVPAADRPKPARTTKKPSSSRAKPKPKR